MKVPMTPNGESLATVIITTFHREALLEVALRSALEQTWYAVEILVIDDSSDCSARETVERSCSNSSRSVGDKTVRYLPRALHRPHDRGVQVCRNIGLQQASGAFVLFLDDDDILDPECIAGRMALLIADESVDFCVGQCAIFDDTPQPTDPLWSIWTAEQDDLAQFLAGAVPWQTSGPLWRRSALVMLGGWDEALVAGHDYELHVRALAAHLPYRRRDVIDYHWRAPRSDSYSGFDRMKALHRDGDLIAPFISALDAVTRHHAWTDDRRAAARREAVFLMVSCRIYGGSLHVAQRVVSAVRKMACVSIFQAIELTMCNAFWFRLGGRSPVLAWLNRRTVYRSAR
jgi:glycosyltransferase involved in cell wall biosynthesis